MDTTCPVHGSPEPCQDCKADEAHYSAIGDGFFADWSPSDEQ